MAGIQDLSMSEPTIENVPGRLSFLWGEEKLKIDVKRFKQHSKDGNETGELIISSTDPAHKKDSGIHHTKLNFTSSASRKALVKELVEDFPDYPWQAIIKHITYQALAVMRQGEPVVKISTTDEIKPLEYLLHPIIPLNEPTVIFGDGGTGKSYLSLLIYICATLPWNKNPLGLKTRENISAKGLLLDWERDKSTVTWRLQCLETGLGLPLLGVNYRRCSYTFADDLERIQEAIVEAGVDFIVIDSLAGACGGDLTASEPATRFYNALRQLKTTSLIIAHNPKGEGKKSIYGSVIFEHRASSVWECRGSQEPGEDELNMGLFHRKANMSRLHPSIGFKFMFGDTSTKVIKRDVSDIPELRGGLTHQAQIYDLLKGGAFTYEELDEALDIDKASIRTTIKRMRDKEQVIHLADGKWGLRAKDSMSD